MATDDKMTIDERRQYLKRMYPRYRDAGYTAKGELFRTYARDIWMAGDLSCWRK